MDLFTLTGNILLGGVDEAKNDITDVTKHVEQSETKLSKAFKRIGTLVGAAFAVNKLNNFRKSITETSASVSAEMSAFEQIMGDYSLHAQNKLNEIAKATSVVNTRLTPYMTSLTAKFRGLGNDINTSTDLASRGLLLVSDSAAFWDKSLDEAVGSLNSFINGSYVGGEAIGLFANDTQMAQYAIQKGLIDSTSEWMKLDEATKQATRLEYAEAMVKSSGAVGQAKKEAEQYANVQGNLTEKWKQFKAEIGKPFVENVVIPIMKSLEKAIDNLSEKWKSLQNWINDNKSTIDKWIDIIIIAGTVIGAYVLVLGTMSILKTIGTWIKAVTTAQTLFNAVMAANPIAAVVAILVGLAVAFVKAYNESETFRNTVDKVFNSVVNFVTKAWDTIKTVCSNIPQFFSKLWTDTVTIFSDTWEKIKAIFNPSEFLNIGKEIIKGLWQGIDLAKDWLVEKTKSIWNFIIGGAKETFEIQSPSKAFEKIGNYLMEGLGLGIENNTDEVTDSIDVVENKTTSFIGEIISKLNNSFSKNPVMRRIGQAFGFEFAEGVEETVEDVNSAVDKAFVIPQKTSFEKLKELWNKFKESFPTLIENIRSHTEKALSYLNGIREEFYNLENSKLEEAAKSKQAEIETLKKETDERIKLAEEEHDKNIELLTDQYNSGLIFMSEYSARKKELDSNLRKYKEDQLNSEKEAENKLAKEKDEILKKQFENKKKFEKSNILINLATAIMKAYADLGVIGGSLATGALVTTSVIQQNIIDSQTYTSAFAKGGIVDKPTVGLVGEAGKEAIVPLENNLEWVGGLAKAIQPTIQSSKYENSGEMINLRMEVITLRIMLSEFLQKLVDKRTDVVINGDSLAYTLAPLMDNNLGNINRMKMRGI